jgi:hypothetical protein
MADGNISAESLTSADTTTLYFIAALQILLILERVFTNVFKRVKHCNCSECCSVDMGSPSISDDSPKIVRRSRELPPKKESNATHTESSDYEA